MSRESVSVRKRDILFSARTVTRIWEEEPAQDNPYQAQHCRCYGYDILELARKRSFSDVLYLLFQGELPTAHQARLFETLMIAFINPGPRHPAARAAMNAGVGKTNPAHILPISLSIMSGVHLGGEEVTESMHFLRRKSKFSPADVVHELLENSHPPEGDWHIAPGFGSRYGGIDPIPQQTAALLCSLPGDWKALEWAEEFNNMIEPFGLGWLSTGVTAAVLCDLGFHPRVGAGIYQIISAPGLLAHGLELANKPITAMPFPDNDHYVIEETI